MNYLGMFVNSYSVIDCKRGINGTVKEGGHTKPDMYSLLLNIKMLLAFFSKGQGLLI